MSYEYNERVIHGGCQANPSAVEEHGKRSFVLWCVSTGLHAVSESPDVDRSW